MVIFSFLYFAGAYWYGTMGNVTAGVLFSVVYFLWMVALTNKTKPNNNIYLLNSR